MPGAAIRCATLAALAACMPLAGEAAPTVLFDGTPNTSLQSQGWGYLAIDPDFPFVNDSTVQNFGTGFQRLDTSPDSSDYTGFIGSLHPLLPALDRNTGFTLNFDLRINAETHSDANRAGFSVTILDQDAVGIELGFWQDRVWAQSDSPYFTHAEDALFDTMSMTRYALSLDATGYSLSANGIPLLSGGLRDYSGYALISPLAAVYTQPNFLFLGDNTSRAAVNADIAYAAIETHAVPAAGAALLMISGVVGFVRRAA